MSPHDEIKVLFLFIFKTRLASDSTKYSRYLDIFTFLLLYDHNSKKYFFSRTLSWTVQDRSCTEMNLNFSLTLGAKIKY